MNIKPARFAAGISLLALAALVSGPPAAAAAGTVTQESLDVIAAPPAFPRASAAVVAFDAAAQTLTDRQFRELQGVIVVRPRATRHPWAVVALSPDVELRFLPEGLAPKAVSAASDADAPVPATETAGSVADEINEFHPFRMPVFNLLVPRVRVPLFSLNW
jgi:hypothetical protein